MARTTFSSRRRPRSQSAARWPGRRILVMSLLTHNPTSTVEQGEALATKKQSFAVRLRREEATAGAPKRMRSRRVALDLPEEIVVWEILVRLPAKEILRCRAVCRSWRGLTSAADFIIAHHRRQPSLPLVVLNGTPATEDGLSISRHSRPVLGFHDYIGFQLHASCDGLLLLTPSNDRFSICNPATRQCAPLPGLPNSSLINIAALYLHCPSREYRVLYWELGHQATYYILTVDRRGSPRCIGVPSDTPAIEKAMLAAHTTYPTNLAPPIKFRSCLHWDHAWDWVHHDAGIVVFNTLTESFRFMRRPAGATSVCTRLSDMEDSIGFSCFDDGRSVVRIWVLRDYEREVWSFKYHVKFPVESLCNLADTKHMVLSHEGDVLVYSKSARHIFQCNNNGKLLQEFRWKSRAFDVIGLGHCFKESLIEHEFFPRRVVGQERFFQSL